MVLMAAYPQKLPADTEPSRPPKSADPSQASQNVSINGASRQLVGVRVRTARNLPETRLDAKFVDLVAEVVKLLNKISVAKRKTTGIHVAVVAPFDNPVSHAVDEICRVGLDDNLVDAAGMFVSTVREDVPELAESVDGG